MSRPPVNPPPDRAGVVGHRMTAPASQARSSWWTATTTRRHGIVLGAAASHGLVPDG
jgi:hypothetical protein